MSHHDLAAELCEACSDENEIRVGTCNDEDGRWLCDEHAHPEPDGPRGGYRWDLHYRCGDRIRERCTVLYERGADGPALRCEFVAGHPGRGHSTLDGSIQWTERS